MSAGVKQLVAPIIPGMREDLSRFGGHPPGTLKLAQNVRFRKGGLAQRRSGTEALPTTVVSDYSLDGPPDFVATLGGAPVVGTNGRAFAYDSTSQKWRDAGSYSTAMPVGRVATMYQFPGAATNAALNGSAVVACDSAGYVVTAVCLLSAGLGGYVCQVNYYDPAGNAIALGSGAPFGTPMPVPGARVRAVAVGATIYVCIQAVAPVNAAVAVYAFTAGAATGPTTLFTLDSYLDSWDISPWPNASASGRWLIAWHDSSSTTTTVRRLNGTATEASATFTPAAAPRLAIYANTDHAWVGTSDTSSGNAIIRCFVFSAGTLSLATAADTVWSFNSATHTSSPPIPGPSSSATTCTLVGWTYGTPGAAASDEEGNFVTTRATYTSAGTVTVVSEDAGGYPTTHPFGDAGEYTWGDRVTNPGATGESAGRFAALTRLSDSGTTLELVTERSAQWIDDSARVDRWTFAAQRPNGNWLVPSAVWIPDTDTGDIYYEILEFEAPCTTTRTVVAAAGALMVPGQPADLILGSADGVDVGHAAPTIVSAVVSAGGGSMTAGDHQLSALYRWVDAAGRLHESAPSPPVTVTVAANDRVILHVSIASLQRITASSNLGQLLIYGTAAGESVFYQVNVSHFATGSDAPDHEAYQGAGVIDYADADITDNPELYTDGGNKQNDVAPACRFLVSTEDTVIAGPLWDRTLWQESKVTIPEEPTLFSEFDGFKIRFPEDTVAGAYVSGQFIAFAERNIYAVSGQGPNDKGEGGRPPPRLVVSGLGCKNERSVVQTPIGVFFESHRGIELLGLGLGTPEFIGEAVQDQLALRPRILDAAMDVADDATTVRFLVDNPDSPAQEFDAAASVGVTSTAGAVGNSVVAAVNHTIGDGANRIVLVFVGIELNVTYTPDTTVCTYNGVTMTRMTEFGSGNFRIAPFYLLESSLPVTGTYSVSVTVPTGSAPTGTSTGVMVGVVSRENAEQSAPTILGTTQAVGTVTEIATTVTAGAYQALVDCVICTGPNGTKAPDAGQTVRADLGSPDEFGVSDKDGPAVARSVTLGWDFTSSQISSLHMVVGVNTDGDAPGTRELVFDVDARAWSVDSHPFSAGALGSTAGGLLFATEDARLVEDPDVYLDDGLFFESGLELHDLYPSAALGFGHVIGLVARVSVDQQPAALVLSLGVDDATPKETAVSTLTSTGFAYRQTDVGAKSNHGTSVQCAAWDSATGLLGYGITWHGFVLLYTDEPTTRPLKAGEKL